MAAFSAKISKKFWWVCIHNVGSSAPGKAVTGRACTRTSPHVRTCGLLGDIIALVESGLSDYVFKTCFLVSLVPSDIYCNKLYSDAMLISCCNKFLLHLLSGLTTPIPAFHWAFGKLKSPMSKMSGVGVLCLFISLHILSIIISLKDLSRVSPW